MYKKYIKACCKASTILAFMLSNSSVIHASVSNHSPAINNAKLSIDNNWNPSAFVNNDLISLIQNYSIILDKQDGVVGSIDLGTSSGSQIFVENSVSVGDVFKNNSSTSIPVQLTDNIPLTLTGNNYSGVMNIRLAPNLNNNSGNIIFKNTYNTSSLNPTGNFNITFDIGTPSLKLNTVGIRQDPVTHYEITTVLKSGHKIYANEFQLASSDPPNNRMDSILELEDDTIMDAAITTKRLDLNGNIYNHSASGGFFLSGGSLIVDEGSVITGQIGTLVDPLYNVTFASNNKNKQVYLGGSIYSEYIYINQPTIIMDSDITFNSAIIAQSPTLNLNDHTLIFQNLHLYNFQSSTSDHYSNNAPSSFSGDATLATTVTNNSFGRIIVNGLRGDPSLNLNQLNIDLNQLNSLTVVLTGLTTTIPGPQGRSYIMLGTVTNGGTINLPLDSKVVLDSSGNTNPFVDWSYSQGVLKEMPKPDHTIQTIISQIISNSGGNNKTIANGKVLTNSQNTESAAALRDEIITAAIVNPTSLNEIVQRLEPVVVEATETTHTSSLEAVSAISDRINRLSTSQNTIIAQNEGISAGNENHGYGVWSSGYYSKAVQKGSSDKPGYNSKTFGGTLGIDKSISDTLTLGLAVSLMSSKIKHSDSNSGDRTTSSGQLLSLYSLNNLTSNLFLQAIALAGTYKINNREKRFNGFRCEIAKGSYRTFSYGTELMLGYDFNIKEYMTFTPLLGLSYYWINKSSYQESGTTNQNFHVSKQSDQKLNGILGAKFTGVNDWNGITFLPEVHGLLRYDLINKDSKIIVSLDGLVDPLIKSTRQEGRAFVNLGLGLNAIYGRMEYGLTYDNYLAKKYIGHQGSLKVRFNF